jgi:hypothetical protein
MGLNSVDGASEAKVRAMANTYPTHENRVPVIARVKRSEP